MTRGGTVNLRNVVVLIGIVVTSVGIIYFATEFIDRLTEWTRVASLVLLTVVYVALGLHFDRAREGADVVERRGWRWLRVTSALYFLGLLSAFTAVLVFLGIDRVEPVVKAATVIAIGLALILWAAARLKGPADDEP